MIFEGTEKKLEIVVAGRPSLRGLERSFWDGIIARSQAVILSSVSNDSCDAYLLSESSLFVYDDRFTMITCGRTTLIDAALAFMDAVPPEQIASLIYERKNENFPGLQRSTFEEDVKVFTGRSPGTALWFGDKSGHYVSLFHLDKPFEPETDDITLEVLMYGLDPKRAKRFVGGAEGTKGIRSRTGIDGLLPGFDIDDHAFTPAGYSLNALQGPAYFTVHVTPEKAGSYASFETNYRFTNENAIRDAVRRNLEIFSPARFDVMLFQARAGFNQLDPDFLLVREDSRRLGCGYDVQFCHFARIASKKSRVAAMPPEGRRTS